MSRRNFRGLTLVPDDHTDVSYTFMVTRFGDYAGLSRPPALFCIGAAVTGIFTIVAQLYYARQVYILGQRKWLIPSLIVGLATLSFSEFAALGASPVSGPS